MTPGRWGPHRGFLYNPNLNKSLRYKGFGGYLVEGAPLRQWGEAHFRMNVRNRGRAQLRLCFNRRSLHITRPGRRLRIRRPAQELQPSRADRSGGGQADP
jgi:hypothetical protein